MSVYQIIYHSFATSLLCEQDIGGMVARAQENNHRCGITGVLLYANRKFIQVLEDEKFVVEPLYEYISAVSAFVNKIKNEELKGW